MKYLLALCLMVCSVAEGKYPYDSVARVGGGSGTLIMKKDGKGVVITNGHVCDNKWVYKVYWPAHKQTLYGKTIMVNHKYDIALLVVEGPKADPVPIGVSDKTNLSAGFPYYDRANLHYQEGKVLADDIVETKFSNRIPPGFSGGASFNSKGQLHAVNKAVNKKAGFGVADNIVRVLLIPYKHPDSWVPDASHLEKENKKEYGKSAPQNGSYKTKKYNPKTAPEL